MALDEGCFHKCLVSDSIILKPHRIGRNVRDVLLSKVCVMYEGVCSRHGYILPGSVRLHHISLGSVEGANLNGDVCYDVQYYALVCNPPIGAVISARVVNKSRFGFLLHSGAAPSLGGDAVAPLSSIVETVVSRQATYTDQAGAVADLDDDNHDDGPAVDLDVIGIGDLVNVRVMGKKFQLNDRHIFVVGRIVRKSTDSLQPRLQAQAHAQAQTQDFVVSIGNDNEDDLSVIAATEVSADERDEEERDSDNQEEEDAVGDGAGKKKGQTKGADERPGPVKTSGPDGSSVEESEDESDDEDVLDEEAGVEGEEEEGEDDDEEEGEEDVSDDDEI